MRLPARSIAVIMLELFSVNLVVEQVEAAAKTGSRPLVNRGTPGKEIFSMPVGFNRMTG